MGYSKDVYEEADKIIRERRNKALREADMRKRTFFISYPEAEKLEPLSAAVFLPPSV